MALKPNAKQTTKPINVCQCTDEVARYLDSLRSQLSKEKLREIDTLVKSIKVELLAEVDNKTLSQLRSFMKHQELDRQTDKACQALPDVPRDLLKHKLHYVLNGVNSKAELALKALEHKAKQKKQTQQQKSPQQLKPQQQKSQQQHDSQPTKDDATNTNTTKDDATNTNSTKDDVTNTDESAGHTTPVENVDSDDDVAVTGTTETVTVDVSPPPAEKHDVATQTCIQESELCVPACSKGSEGDMVRCIICMRWYHPGCCDSEEDAKYKTAVWSCSTCRLMPQQLSVLQKKLNLVLSLLANSKQAEHVQKLDVTSQSHDSTDVIQVIDSASSNEGASSDSEPEAEPESSPSDSSDHEDDHASDSSASNSEWQKQRSEKRRLKKRKPKQQIPAPAHKVVLVCDSMPKKVNTDYLARKGSASVDIKEVGDTVGQATYYVQSTKPSTDPAYLIIHTGTRHIEHEGIKRTMDRFDRLEHNVKLKYKHVALSSIIHRNSTEATRKNIQLLNNKLAMMCAKNHWVFIDNDNIDEYCLGHDGIHLNSVGDERFTLNILNGVKHLVH
jgi:hypothetical protein